MGNSIGPNGLFVQLSWMDFTENIIKLITHITFKIVLLINIDYLLINKQ